MNENRLRFVSIIKHDVPECEADINDAGFGGFTFI